MVLEWPGVSRSHAQILQQDPGCHIYDLGSTNGTFVNETRIGPAGHLLQHGDHIRLGSSKTLLIFRADESGTVVLRSQTMEPEPAKPAPAFGSGMTQSFKVAMTGEPISQYLKSHPEGADWDTLEMVAGLPERELLKTLGMLMDSNQISQAQHDLFRGRRSVTGLAGGLELARLA